MREIIDPQEELEKLKCISGLLFAGRDFLNHPQITPDPFLEIEISTSRGPITLFRLVCGWNIGGIPFHFVSQPEALRFENVGIKRMTAQIDWRASEENHLDGTFVAVYVQDKKINSPPEYYLTGPGTLFWDFLIISRECVRVFGEVPKCASRDNYRGNDGYLSAEHAQEISLSVDPEC